MILRGIGGSDIAAILGLSPWASPWDVYLRLTEGQSAPDSGVMQSGRYYEQGVCDWYLDQLRGLGVEATAKTPEILSRGVLRASVDRIVTNGEGQWGLEIKTAGSRDGWGEEGSDQIPIYYAAQVHWYMGFYDVPFFDVAVGFLDWQRGFAKYRINRDEELSKELLARGEAWFQKHIVDGKPIDIDGSQACTDYLRKRYGSVKADAREANQEEIELLRQYQELDKQLEEIESKKSMVKNRLIAAIGDNDGIYGGPYKITYRPQKRTSFDSAKFKEENQDLYNQYQKTAEFRTFRFTSKEK